MAGTELVFELQEHQRTMKHATLHLLFVSCSPDKFGNPKEVTSSTAVFTRSRLRLWTFTPTDPTQKIFFRPEILWSHLSDF